MVKAAAVRRAMGVGVGSAVVGALMLGAATSSTYSDASVTVPEDGAVIEIDDSHAGIVAARSDAALLGFAPPSAGLNTTVGSAVDPQFRISADLPSGPLGIPGVMLSAYQLAADRIAQESPQCKLPWFLLAGIGRIESGHANNGALDEFGTAIVPIKGPVLDGTLAGNEVITDTDGGAYDGDPNFDRAVGPMQFIPSTWARWGSDANGDGVADPQNAYDATYSAGRYLCAGVTDIMSEQNQVGAVLRYNRSMPYVQNVLAWAAAYATGVMPTNPIPEMPATPTPGETGPDDPDATRDDADATDDDATDETDPTTTTPAPAPAEECVIVCLPPIELPPLPF